MEKKDSEPVCPGERVKVSNLDGTAYIGPGLIGYPSDEYATATQLGIFHQKSNCIHWVQSIVNCYTPFNNDTVVGIVMSKRGDMYKVDINGPEPAMLSSFAFESATKKQKPTLEEGDAIYARILLANVGMEPELVCVDSYYKAGLLGILSEEGHIFQAQLNYVRQLLHVDDKLLETIGKKLPFEIVVGLNGYIWLYARTTKDMLFVYQCLVLGEKSFENNGCTLPRELREMLE